MWPTPITFVGLNAKLEPLSQQHHDDLVEAVCDGDLWDHWYTAIPTPEGMATEIDRRLGLLKRFAACFVDGRSPGAVEHTIERLVGQRVLGIALGYEDVNDHDELRHDRALAATLGRLAARRSRCAALAGVRRLVFISSVKVLGEALQLLEASE